MTKTAALLALDQGTTSSRAIVFDLSGHVVAQAQREFDQIYPRPGWVEHDPEVIWATILSTAREALRDAHAKGYAAEAIGITNQRETTLIWDRRTGEALANAIVWQDRRTAEACAELQSAGLADLVQARTGLVLDPYFSATKIAWLLDTIPNGRQRAEAGELAFGTVDSWLIWRLTGGRVHATDATNASRTSLYNLETGDWDADMLDLFQVPAALLPQIRDCADHFGDSDEALFGVALPITGVAGDQQAATIGQACFEPGEMKSTYGTGAFMLLNTGQEKRLSRHRLLTTLAYRLGGVSTYALEGSVLSAGATIQWLRDGLGLIAQARDVEALAAGADPDSGVYLVPAFTGLGAPHWDAQARGAIIGLTRGSSAAEIAQAALDSVAHQTCDLLEAMQGDGAMPVRLKVDGGMARNNRLLQRMSDLTTMDVVRPVNTETTAWGAAFLAGLGAGLFASLEDGRAVWSADKSFSADMPEDRRLALRAGWSDAISRVSAGAQT